MIQFEANPCDEADCGLVGFSLVGISAIYGSCPNSPFVLFDPHHGPFYAPKTSHFEGKMSKFAKNEKKKKTWENAKRTNATNIPISSSVFALWEPTQPKKIPKFAMCLFGTQVAQQVDSNLQPANSPKHVTDAGVQFMWERVLCNSYAINSPNIFSCNPLRGMSLHISENQFPNNFFVRVIFSGAMVGAL